MLVSKAIAADSNHTSVVERSPDFTVGLNVERNEELDFTERSVSPPMSSSAQPLKVPTTPRTDEKDKTPKPAHKVLNNNKNLASPSDISSPHELTAFVETLLEQLDAKFDDMSTQILERMSQMSTRVDALEASIQDIINGDVSVPQSPSPSSSNLK